MSQSQLLMQVIHVLDVARIDYMITGSLVSSLQGEPRSTHDIDIVVALNSNQAPAILSAFRSPDFYADADAIMSAISDRGSFNVIDMRSGYKIDFWLLKDNAFDQSRFRRRVQDDIDGVMMAVSSPEDTILMKLNWARQSGGSEKQYRDALRVYELQYAHLNQGYLTQWAIDLEVTELLQQLRQDAQPLK